MTKLSLTLLFAAIAGTNAFAPSSSTVRYTVPGTQLAAKSDNTNDAFLERRNFLATAAATAAAAIVAPVPAYASGGATAGKYTTIPIAKRRYYGRVQEAVHEFLLMAPAVIKGDLTDPTVQDFFDVTKTVVVEGKKKDINGVCTKKDGDCKSTDIFDSRYNDMKTSMYLLGNAFRINQQKAPDNLPTVKAAKKFFKQMNLLERRVVKNPKSNDTEATAIYAAALDLLDEYLDLVELPPTESGHYDKEFSTLVGETSRIT
eukprot:CAMPEP_0183702540 /NCGR_PEP_ID=MMETSP0737-20130205/606_1 /TAXON_ID=385413 /ORGANISM="Thalassiosira miniscula, Strain CCMP1093" /LENGTH=258 /DNA_ID=CAMNT_0025929161 /DNA_START=24 /DNA_END=800 /DNA_ORIENTATION=+